MQTVTMSDVARAAGVSRALVSLAYRDAYGVSAETRTHILETGKSLGYLPNRVAAQLAGKQQLTIGVFLQDLHNDLFADIFDGIREICDKDNKNTVLAIGAIDGSRDANALDSLLESRVDVIIAAGLTMSDQELESYTHKVKMVSVTRKVDNASSVYSDNNVGSQLAVKHLVDLGHSKIVMIANPPSDGYRDRAEGYKQAMLEHNLEPQVSQGSYSRSKTEQIARQLLANHDRPSAIFAHNDQTALGVMDAAISLGLKIGEDISVVGYDNTSLSQTPSTSLTTVDVHGVELGKIAAELAIGLLQDEKKTFEVRTIEPTLVVRGSSSAPRA